MGKLSGLFLVMALVLAMVAGARSDACDDSLKNLFAECKQYILNPPNPKIAPSDACCGEVQKVDVPCLCSKVTPETEKLVCMEKVVYVADYCKRPLKPGSKCGSYTVPSISPYKTRLRYQSRPSVSCSTTSPSPTTSSRRAGDAASGKYTLSFVVAARDADAKSTRFQFEVREPGTWRSSRGSTGASDGRLCAVRTGLGVAPAAVVMLDAKVPAARASALDRPASADRRALPDSLHDTS
ncbi:hypothetical protein ABZP36_015966 [Zizania latifolia]